MSIQQRLDNAKEAEAALRVLDTAFDAVVASYVKRLAELGAAEQTDVVAIKNIGRTLQGVELARAHIKAIAVDGEVALTELRHRRQIEQMSPESRKVLGISVRV